MTKKKTLEDIIIESWEGARREHYLFSERSDDFFVGYATGITKINNPRLDCSTTEIEKKIRELLENKKI